MIWIGTSGFQYPEWKGKFYPATFSTKKMLSFYSGRFNSTESNYTFRRMPTPKVLSNWAAQTHAAFRFTLKAPQAVTHRRRLRDCGALVHRFFEAAEVLGPKRGAVLFQLEPTFECDVALLQDFLRELPPNAKAAFEFRHASWFSDDVFEALQVANCALCIADSRRLTTPVVFTARHAYFRLRHEDYVASDLLKWSKHIRAADGICEDVYVYFKHEVRAVGPAYAAQLQALLALRR